MVTPDLLTDKQVRRFPRPRQGRGVIIASPASGSGKTLVTAGLLRHLRRSGIEVAGAKAGPEFLAPNFQTAGSGKSCLTLDVWAMRSPTLASLIGELGAAN